MFAFLDSHPEYALNLSSMDEDVVFGPLLRSIAVFFSKVAEISGDQVSADELAQEACKTLAEWVEEWQAEQTASKDQQWFTKTTK